MNCRVLLTACLLLLPVTAQADDSSFLTFNLENDSFIDHIDRHYTSGLYAAWTGAPQIKTDDLTSIAQAAMLPGDGSEIWRTSFFVGQSMFTPQDLDAVVPPSNDRPYAGWLFAGTRIYRDSGDALDSADVTLGIVGPGSLAADLQESWHQLGLFGGIYPNGWHYQLRGEPGLVLGEQHIWRVGLSEGPLEAELLPEVNARLGNVFTFGGAGAMLRIGSGLKSDWGPTRIVPAQSGADYQSGDAFGWYLFAGFEGRAVARNIFLNGNSFESSARVSSKLLVGDFSGGVAIMFPGARLTATYTNRSQEFVGQVGNDEYVSINLNIAN